MGRVPRTSLAAATSLTGTKPRDTDTLGDTTRPSTLNTRPRENGKEDEDDNEENRGDSNDKGSAQFAFAYGTVLVVVAVAAILPVVALAPVAFVAVVAVAVLLHVAMPCGMGCILRSGALAQSSLAQRCSRLRSVASCVVVLRIRNSFKGRS